MLQDGLLKFGPMLQDGLLRFGPMLQDGLLRFGPMDIFLTHKGKVRNVRQN